MYRVSLVLCGLLLSLLGAANAHAALTPAESAAVSSATSHQMSTAAESNSRFDTDRSHDRQPARDSSSQDPTDSRDLIDQNLDDLDDDDERGGAGDPDSSPLGAFTFPGLRSPLCASTLWLSQGGRTLATTYLTDSVRRL